MNRTTDGLERLAKVLVEFTHAPDWSPDAVAPEDNADWRCGYECALSNLRETLKPWWPYAQPLNLAALAQSTRAKGETDA